MNIRITGTCIIEGLEKIYNFCNYYFTQDGTKELLESKLRIEGTYIDNCIEFDYIVTMDEILIDIC